MDGSTRLRIATDLGGLELLEAVYSRPRFARHAHATYALGLVSWGTNRFRYRGGFHDAGAGALCTVTPDEVHEVEPAGKIGFAYWCLYPSAELLRSAAEGVEGRRVTRTLALPPVIHDLGASRLLAAVFHAEAEGAPVLERAERLLALLARVVVRHARSPAILRPLAQPARAVARVRDYLCAHLSENVSLTRLAALAELDPFALLRGFSRAYGLPPHAWLVQERVRRAQERLRDGLRPGAAAALVGFSDQSHLTRHFKRIVGVTPGCYRRAAAQVVEPR